MGIVLVLLGFAGIVIGLVAIFLARIPLVRMTSSEHGGILLGLSMLIFAGGGLLEELRPSPPVTSTPTSSYSAGGFLGTLLGTIFPGLIAGLVGYLLFLRHRRSLSVTLVMAVLTCLIGKFHGLVVDTGVPSSVAALITGFMGIGLLRAFSGRTDEKEVVE